MAQEKGEEFDTFKNPDSPIQMSGNIPPGLKEMMQQRGGGQAAPAPAKRKMESKEASKVASDAYDALMEKLVSHSTWEAVELPSRGKFYDSIPGVLHLRPMTGNEEQILATPRHVRRGKAIDMIFEKCIRENIQPSELLSIDRDYLLIFLRGISYTPEYDVEVRCPECAQKFNTIIDLNSLDVESCPDDFTPEKLSGILPTTGVNFKYRLATGEDEAAITNYKDARIREFGAEADDDTLLYRTALLLTEIAGVTDKKELGMVLKKLPINDVSHLRNVIADPPFGVDKEIGMICAYCTHPFEIDMPYEANFFFPRKKKMTPQ
jgi:hypothetical protein